MLWRLGLDMGAPFWGEFHEPEDLAARLREWWKEPYLTEQVDRNKRVRELRQWLTGREAANELNGGTSSGVGAKHPLLSLCGQDLLAAWGPQTKFIWSWRPLEKSSASLERLGWWPDAVEIQQRLWDACQQFFAKQPYLRVDYDALLLNPRETIIQLSDYLELTPTADQLDAAVTFVAQHPTRKRTNESGFSCTEAALATGLQSARPLTTEITRIGEAVRPKIVATMLSGNAEALAAEAVRSAIAIVDELLLIDTGISDSTCEIVREVAREKFRLATFAWRNDFSAARNTALALAARQGATWALTLDTDERLELSPAMTADALRRMLMDRPSVNAWMVTARDGSYAKERLIRVPTRLEWRGRTHEALCGAGPGERLTLPGVTFWEAPKTAVAFRRKLERDEAILREETAEHPKNGRWWFYLGQTLRGLTRHREAIEAYHKCASLDGWPEETAWACHEAARSFRDVGLYRRAIEYCGRGLAKQPGTPELAYLAAWCCDALGDYRGALDWAHIAISLGHVAGNRAGEHRLGFRDQIAWYEGPYDVLRRIHTRLANEAEAEDAARMYDRAQRLRLGVLDASKSEPSCRRTNE
ncbi:MAG: tetratricopeptide repeat protein [Planctomycetales bacterium]|nr:tetratricopeptide repeat protein [Planctomycetales bacterium]